MNELCSTNKRPKRALITGVTGQAPTSLDSSSTRDTKFTASCDVRAYSILIASTNSITIRMLGEQNSPCIMVIWPTVQRSGTFSRGSLPMKCTTLGPKATLECRSISLNTRPTSMLWARSGCSRPCVIMFANAASKFAIIKPAPLKCSGRRLHPRTS
jgi:hypothetical protein